MLDPEDLVMRALEETAIILKAMFEQERVSFEGKHFQVRDVISEPKPIRRPPVLIGGGGEPPQLRLIFPWIRHRGV